MKTCTCCKQEKSKDQFYTFNRGAKKSILRSECKQCTLQKKREREKMYNQEYEKWFQTIPKKCEHCGETKAYVIDFHHLDPSNKECEVADIRSRSWSVKRKISVAKKEMAKCIQLCSNCHREFHHLERKLGFKIDDYIQRQK